MCYFAGKQTCCIGCMAIGQIESFINTIQLEVLLNSFFNIEHYTTWLFSSESLKEHWFDAPPIRRQHFAVVCAKYPFSVLPCMHIPSHLLHTILAMWSPSLWTHSSATIFLELQCVFDPAGADSFQLKTVMIKIIRSVAAGSSQTSLWHGRMHLKGYSCSL